MSSNALPEESSQHSSRTCEGGACIKVMRRGDAVIIGSGDPTDPIAEFTIDEWRHFLNGVKLGDFDDIA